jgi:hypothetical protein
MPKAKPSKSCHLNQIILEFGDDIFSTDGDILYCIMCGTKVAAGKRLVVQQHISHDKHIRAVQISSKNKSVQILLQQRLPKVQISHRIFFFRNLCDALVFSNIPMWFLNHEILKFFWK